MPTKAKQKPKAKAQPPKAKKPPLPAKPGKVTKFVPPWESGTAGPSAGFANEADPGEPYDFRHVHPRIAAIRRLFVSEFVKDFNGSAALARLGFVYKNPAITANKWLSEPFTQHCLDKFVRSAEDAALITRQEILAGLKREAHAFGLDASGASRVSAFGKLAKILGLEITKVEANVTAAGGIMLVPIGGNPDDWEKNAAAAQATLKANAK